MKSRRRIAFAQGPGPRRVGANYSRDLRPAEWGPTIILRSKNPRDRMSALGQKQTFSNVGAMSALPPKADIALHRSECPLCANSGREQVQQKSTIEGSLFDHLVGERS